MIPGEYILASGEIIANAGRRTAKLTVTNTVDRPVQVGSHYHFLRLTGLWHLTVLQHGECV